MARIIPIRDLRNTTEISHVCNSTSEPIFVTKNGYGDLVVMSIKTFEEYFEDKQVAAGLKSRKNPSM